MNNTATDPTNNMPVVRQDGSNRNQDIVQSPGGQMTRAEAVVYAQQNPAAPKTGAALTAHLQRQFKEGKITEQELQLYSVNALRGNDQDPLTEEEQRQHLEHTRDVQEWNMHAAASASCRGG